jgi:peptidylprolyl isomerase
MSQTTSDRPVSARTRMLRRGLVVPALAVALIASGCGKKDELKGDVVKDGLGCTTSKVDRRDHAPEVAPGVKVGKKVTSIDLTKGKGRKAGAECFLSLDIVGTIAEDGKVFSSTFETGHPITVPAAATGLVAGLDTGIKDMKVGTRRQIAVPAKEAYGKEGNPAQDIGKDADLIFVVDLIAVSGTPIYCSALNDLPTEEDGKKIEGKPVDVEMPVEVPDSKVETRDMKKGTGETVTEKSYVTVQYYGVSCLTGRQFSSSYDGEQSTGEPFTAALSGAKETPEASGVIPGWTEGLVGMKAGGIRQLNIPFNLAYGAQGRDQGDLGPYATLVFVIEVLDATTKAPATTTTTAPEGATTTTVAPDGGETTTTAAADDTTTTTAAESTTTTAG